MTDAIEFDSTTPRYDLPLLFAGQAQKELTVNEVSARIDMLLHPAIAGIADGPPAAPAEGVSWLIGTGLDAWLGHAGEIAIWSGGNWLFGKPRAGLRVYDVAAETTRVFTGTGWRMAERPEQPAGGSIVDSEARAAIASIYDILATLGWIPPA